MATKQEVAVGRVLEMTQQLENDMLEGKISHALLVTFGPGGMNIHGPLQDGFAIVGMLEMALVVAKNTLLKLALPKWCAGTWTLRSSKLISAVSSIPEAERAMMRSAREGVSSTI